MFRNLIRPALLMMAVMTLLTGVIYPLFVTAVAQVAFSGPAAGSLIFRDGKAVGSSLIGQAFDDPKYFWSRPSATAPFPYNAGASSGSNLGPSDPALTKAIQPRVEALWQADPDSKDKSVPIDLVSTSASGLDPHISPAAAAYQIHRVAKVRGLEEAEVGKLVAKHTAGRTFGLLGEPRVNVVELNLALDDVQSDSAAPAAGSPKTK